VVPQPAPDAKSWEEVSEKVKEDKEAFDKTQVFGFEHWMTVTGALVEMENKIRWLAEYIEEREDRYTANDKAMIQERLAKTRGSFALIELALGLEVEGVDESLARLLAREDES
jgi:hypothetical protein